MSINLRRSSRGSGGRSGCGTKIFGSLFFSIFLLLGLAATGAMVLDFFQALSAYGWEETDCEILASSVVEEPAEGSGETVFRFDTRYRYAVDGRELVGERVRRGYYGDADPAEAQRLRQAYPAGAWVTCYVDPEDPTAAALRRPDLTSGLFAFIPLVFVAVGGVGLLLLWGSESRLVRAVEAKVKGLAERRPGTVGGGCLAAFFGVFLLAGLGFLVPFFALPAAKVVAARSWQPVPCEIVSSSVRTHSGDDSDTYSVDILYRYRVDGVEYRSSRYHFLGGSSSGYEGKAAVVERYPAGAEATCWVDPDDPVEAVIERGFTGDFLFGLIPLVFVGVGGVGATWALVSARKVRRREREAMEPALDLPPVPSGRGAEAFAASGKARLKPRFGPLGKLVGILLIAAFWNGITGVFVWQVVKSFQAGSPEWFLTLFLSPFVLIGLVLLVGVPYQFLALFNPRPHFSLTPSPLVLGQSAEVEWRFSLAAGRIRRLKIRLEGRQIKRQRTGSSTSTRQSTFYTLEVADTENPTAILAGSASITVPPSAVHEAAPEADEIRWHLKVQGVIRWWPDVIEGIPVEVQQL